MQDLKISLQRGRGIKFGNIEHRSEGIHQFEHQVAPDERTPAVGDRFFVAGFDIDLQLKGVARTGSRMDAGVASQRGDRPEPEVDRGHRNPGCQLADGLGHQTDRKARGAHRYGVEPAGSRNAVDERDAIDEGKCSETTSGRGLIYPRHAQPHQPAACAARCARITSLQKVSGV